MINYRVQKVAYWALMLTIFLAYWLFSRQYTGPAYLSDEIGYLTKAAAFAGYPVDMASQWHGGYSLILSPLFMIFTDPFVVWQGIMILNATMWAFSFMLLFSLLKEFFPSRNFWAIFSAVAISAIYPAWITMSGYAFSTTAFVLVYMLSILVLRKSTAGDTWSITPFSLLVGFLYWIHPTGLAVAVASFFAVLIVAWRHNRYAILVIHVFVTVGMMAIYRVGVHDWVNQIMTPENYDIGTNYITLSSVLQSFSQVKFWVAWIVISLGQISYLLIATLGLFFFAVVETWTTVIPTRSDLGSKIKTPVLVDASLTFMTLSILGVVLLGSLSFATNAAIGPIRPDHWIYGRYSEMTLLPVLAIGILTQRRFIYATLASFIVLVSGLILHLYSSESNTSDFNNLVNIQSFWPQFLFTHESYMFWFILGAIGITVAGAIKRELIILLAMPIFAISIIEQNSWHTNILAGHSKPSSLVELVTLNFKKGQCIGIDPFWPRPSSGKQRERRHLYSYYFFNYEVRRMSPAEWYSNCDGPYITYRPEVFSESPNVNIVAKEVPTRLYLVTNAAISGQIPITSLPSTATDLQLEFADGNNCLTHDCFSMSASSLMQFSQVGRYRDGGLTPTKNSGYLFYGPYYSLRKGEYVIKLEGKFIDLNGAVLDVVSGHGKLKHSEYILSEFYDSLNDSIYLPFSIEYDVFDIEIRLHVKPSTDLTFFGYSISSY